MPDLKGRAREGFSAILSSMLFGFFLTVFLGCAPLSAAENFSYDAKISGLDGGEFADIRATFKATSLLEARRSDVLVSISNLRRLIKSDVRLMTRILRSYGYYGGRVSERVARNGDHFDIDIHVESGAQYTIGDVIIDYQDPPPDAQIRDEIYNSLTLVNGGPAISENVVMAEAQILNILPEYGFPFAQKINREVVVDHSHQSMNPTFIIASGPRQKIGEVRVEGLGTVKESYIHTLYAWGGDAYYDQKLIEGLRSELDQSRLFSRVSIEVVPGVDDHADVVVALTEAEHRTLGISAGYSTAEGLGGEVSWEHRNIFHRGNRLKLTAHAAEIEQSLASRFEIPNFSRLDQVLFIEGALRRQDTAAYYARVAEARIGLERVITPRLALFGHVEFEYSDINDQQVNHQYVLASLPMGARWDSSDDLLDPSRGLRVSGFVAPTNNFGAQNFTYLKSEIRGSTYYPLVSDERLVLAVRARLGTILGAETVTLPATHRFFAGGGGSLRGFSFQKVGPLDAANKPLGGRSVAEIATEGRWRLSEKIGVVAFVEGGNVYRNKFPQLSGFRWAVGAGVRYHTSFAPIRFDMAFPLNRRPGESRMQFYISLGQAF